MINKHNNLNKSFYCACLSEIEINSIIENKKKYFCETMIKTFPNILIKCKKVTNWFCIKESFLKDQNKDFLLSIALLEKISSLIKEFEEEVAEIKAGYYYVQNKKITLKS
ncbi:hypothetical protein [Spiroplasma tabanidicola]|uniref:Uncharacterized protein n=1 Tax=Spiroplasma tabanidicola TaxID=324079 RepID=A0A6I6C742_9MOLU|nr:hypothetical protein [Spiroplasma tabanidicola]QGS52030.1 hypothetical protein STABA_v1c06690 [Spiroplasma tabanidicola]